MFVVKSVMNSRIFVVFFVMSIFCNKFKRKGGFTI